LHQNQPEGGQQASEDHPKAEIEPLQRSGNDQTLGRLECEHERRAGQKGGLREGGDRPTLPVPKPVLAIRRTFCLPDADEGRR